jgi:GAF domain-containing protein
MTETPWSGPVDEGAETRFLARFPQLLEAMRAVGWGLELRGTLDRICGTAARLARARYAAIGVVSEDREGLAEFVYHGVGEETARAIGHLPDGHHGLLGALIHEPRPLLVPDIAADPRSCGFPPHHPPMRTFLGVPILVGEEVFGNLYLTEKENGTAFDSADLSMVRVLAAEAGIAIGNARLHEAASRRARWIDGSVAITTALLSGDEAEDADDALGVVAEQARRLAQAEAGAVLLPRAAGEGMEIVALATDDPVADAPRAATPSADRASGPPALGTVLPEESELLAALRAGETVSVPDAAEDPRLRSPLAGRYGPVLVLPLASGGRVLGALGLARRPGARPYAPTERTLARQFADQAALALLLAEAQRDRERLAVFEDRDRIARDLHDLVIQRLFATGLMLESTQRKADAPEVRDGIAKAVDELDVTIQEIRTAIFALQQGPAEAPSSLRTRILREINTAAVLLGFTPEHRFRETLTRLSASRSRGTSWQRSARRSRTRTATPARTTSRWSSTPRRG